MDSQYTLRHEGNEAPISVFSARALIRAKLVRLDGRSPRGNRALLFMDDVEPKSRARVFAMALTGEPLRFRVSDESRGSDRSGGFDPQLIFGGKRKNTRREMLFSVDWDEPKRRVDYRTVKIGNELVRVRSGNSVIRHAPWQGPPPIAYLSDVFVGAS